MTPGVITILSQERVVATDTAGNSGINAACCRRVSAATTLWRLKFQDDPDSWATSRPEFTFGELAVWCRH